MGCRKSMGGVGQRAAGVGRVKVHPPTAGTQHPTAPTAASSPSCPGKAHLESSAQLWEVGWCSVPTGTDSKRFWWPLAIPLPAAEQCHSETRQGDTHLPDTHGAPPAALRAGTGACEGEKGRCEPEPWGCWGGFGQASQRGEGKGSSRRSSWKRLGDRGAGSAGGGGCAGGTPSRNAGSERDGWEERSQAGSAGGKWLPG